MTPHQKVFHENNNPPWECCICHELVQLNELTIHHLDEDHFNNDPANLAATHHACHTHLHRVGKPKSEEHKANLSKALRGKPHSDAARASSFGKVLGPMTEEHKQKIGDANRGRVHSEESRAAMRAGQMRRNQQKDLT